MVGLLIRIYGVLFWGAGQYVEVGKRIVYCDEKNKNMSKKGANDLGFANDVRIIEACRDFNSTTKPVQRVNRAKDVFMISEPFTKTASTKSSNVFLTKIIRAVIGNGIDNQKFNK